MNTSPGTLTSLFFTKRLDLKSGLVKKDTCFVTHGSVQSWIGGKKDMTHSCHSICKNQIECREKGWFCSFCQCPAVERQTLFSLSARFGDGSNSVAVQLHHKVAEELLRTSAINYDRMNPAEQTATLNAALRQTLQVLLTVFQGSPRIDAFTR